MDPRRSLISHGFARAVTVVALGALALLPAACATQPALSPPPQITAFSVQPARFEPLTLASPPQVVLASCRSRSRLSARSTMHRKVRTGVAACRITPEPPVVTMVAVHGLTRSAPPDARLIAAVARVMRPGLTPASAPVVQQTPVRTPPPNIAMTPRPVGLMDHMDGAVHVFAYAAGRVYAVRTAPLRVTTLSLQPGETLIDKAAGDTVRWEIGETTSGSGASAHSLVMIKPMTAGLATNMVLTTSQRVYLLDLTSRARDPDRAVSWAYAEPNPTASVKAAVAAPALTEITPAPASADKVSTRYRIAAVGRPPRWTPLSVFDDGRSTFIAFRPDLDRGSAPLLFVDDEVGHEAIVNYRQAGDLFIVDRLFDRAELRLGDRHPEVVRLIREEGASR